MLRSSSYASRLLYHQYLEIDDVKYDPKASGAATRHPSSPIPRQPYFQWDLPTTCKLMFPAFNFISQKLAENGLQITLLVSDQAPFVIPVWPLSRKSQVTLVKIVRRACSRFKISPSWMTALASLECKKDLPQVFEIYRPDSYLVQRSLLQHEMVFSAEGFTLLSMDHIYTLKQLLCTLTKEVWVSYSRDLCLTSCAHLLRRINTIHNGTRFTKGYIARVYLEVPFQESVFDEVMAEYEATFCTANIRDISAELDFMSFYDLDNLKLAQGEELVSPIVELPDTGINELVSPLTAMNMSRMFPWNVTPSETERFSNITVTYPTVEKPSSTPTIAQEAAVWHRSTPTSPASSDESWGPDAPPSPLKIAKRASTQTLALGATETTAEPSAPSAPSALSAPSESVKVEDSIEEGDRGSRPLSFQALEEQETQRPLFEETSRMIIEAWNKGVQDVICSRCYEAIEEPRRYVLSC